MRATIVFFERMKVRKFTAGLLAVVLVMGMCFPSISLATETDNQDGVASLTTDGDADSQAANDGGETPANNDPGLDIDSQPASSPAETILPTSEDIDALQAAAQAAIDALPDTTAEGFAITPENEEAYTQQLTTANDAIAAFIAAGGTDSQLDMTKFDDVTAAMDQYLASKSEEGQLSPQSEDEWASVEDTFTVEAIQQFIPDPGFAQAVYDNISFAIQNDEYHIDKANICDPEGYSDLWPEPLTVEEILDEGTEGDDLVIAILENYVGPINAYRRGVKDITGFQYLKNATSVNFTSNNIEDLTPFTDCVVGGAYDFHNNPIHIWPKTLADTVRSATHGFSTYYQVTTAPLAYRFGETVTPTLTYDVYYPDKDTLNNEWYTKYWINTSAYGGTIPAAPQANGAGGGHVAPADV